MKLMIHHEHALSTLMQPSGVNGGGVWVDLNGTDARMIARCSRQIDRRGRLDRLVAIALSGGLFRKILETLSQDNIFFNFRIL